MTKHWNDKVVVVTGATAGVGRATVRQLARGGASIGLLARDPERLRRTALEVEQLGGQALAVSADVADSDAVERAATRIESSLGPIDVWINNAMTAVFGELLDITPAEYRRVMEVTHLGTVWGTKAALRRMLPRNRGRIVLVGSALAWRGIPLQSACCASKHATLGMFEALRAELEHRGSGVSIGIVHLPAVNTPQFDWVRSKLPRRAQPVPPIFQPEIPARAIELAARRRDRTVHVTTTTTKVIWGARLLPWLGNLILGRQGYDDQMTDEREDPDRPDNLFEPVPGRQGARGRFDARARNHSPRLWLRENRSVLLAMTGFVAAALVAGRSHEHRRPH